MSYKLGFILSLFFVMQVLCFSADLGMLSSLHNELDAIAQTASYQISMNGRLTPSIVTFVEEQTGASIYVLPPYEAKLGESLTFVVEKAYTPVVISKNEMMIRVQRTAIIGYYA